MRNILLIGTGGFIGALMRYFAILSVQSIKLKTEFPFGTLLVNILGCLVIGFLSALAERGHIISNETRNFLVVGLLGAFTTFSTFGYESINLFKEGMFIHFFLNILLQLGLGLSAVWGGMQLAILALKR